MSFQHHSALLSSFLFAAVALAGCTLDSGSPADAPTPVADSGMTDQPLRCIDTGVVTQVPTAPKAPSAPPASGSTARWFALDGLHFQGDPANASTCGWVSTALDLDHMTTDPYLGAATQTSCAKVTGAPTNALLDGVGGVDDNFATQIYPMFRSIDSCLGDVTYDGATAVLLRLDTVSDADATEVGGAIFLARANPADQSASATESGVAKVWSVDARSLGDGQNLSAPIAVFTGGYVRDGVWVSGIGTGRALLPMPLQLAFSKCDSPSDDKEIDLPIAQPQLVVHLDGSMSIVAGVIPASELNTALTPAMASWGICPGTTVFASVQKDFVEAADLPTDSYAGPDPTRACDGISFGAGFTMHAVAAPTTVVATAAPAATGCEGDAGAGSQ